MKKSIKITSIAIVLLIFVMVIGFGFYKFIRHERFQDATIHQLASKVELLEKKKKVENIHWADDMYNYLAIGNSITLHSINDYWWNKNGMSATTLENDYVHQLSSMISEVEGEVFLYAYNFSIWEMIGKDRGECLDLLDDLMSEKLDLVTIQLSENVVDLKTFESDFEQLIIYVKNAAPMAEIIIIGDFWDTKQKDDMKEKVSKKCNVAFVNLDDIKNNVDYQCGLGTIVYDSEGNKHIVEHDGVATHPNDKAMNYIAHKIFETIKK